MRYLFLLLLPCVALAEPIEVGLPAEARTPRPFESLAHLALALPLETYGVSIGAPFLGSEIYYIVDGCCFGPCDELEMRPSQPCAQGRGLCLWSVAGAPLREHALVMDGVPQPAWRLSLPHE